MQWEVIYYSTPSGKQVVADFITNLDTKTYAKTMRQIDLLESYGTNLGMPHSKSLGDGLLELRVRGKREVRIFYAYVVDKRIILLHGFIKKTQSTPIKELDIAIRRKKEIDSL